MSFYLSICYFVSVCRALARAVCKCVVFLHRLFIIWFSFLSLSGKLSVMSGFFYTCPLTSALFLFFNQVNINREVVAITAKIDSAGKSSPGIPLESALFCINQGLLNTPAR